MFLSRRHMIAGVVATTALTLPPSVLAHRQPTTYTDIIWNEPQSALEITHVLHIHNAETALRELGLLPNPDLNELKAQAQLALYVEDQFQIEIPPENKLALNLLGAEQYRQNLYIYQDIKLKEPPARLRIRCSIFRDIIPNQANHVNVNVTGSIRSLTFSQYDGAKIVLA